MLYATLCTRVIITDLGGNPCKHSGNIQKGYKMTVLTTAPQMLNYILTKCSCKWVAPLQAMAH